MLHPVSALVTVTFTSWYVLALVLAYVSLSVTFKRMVAFAGYADSVELRKLALKFQGKK
jgi:hypothetical protein